MITALNRPQKFTVELTITIPWSEVKKEFEKSLGELCQEIELPGFRKGKAPKELVEKSISKDKLRESVLTKIIPQSYSQAIKDNGLKPIVNPRIQILSVEENKDWSFKALTCETPAVELGNYRKEIDALYTKDKIWVPGKSDNKPENQASKKEDYLQQVLDIILKTTKVEIPEILVEDETNRLLADLLDQTQKLGLTVEQYLTARNITSDQIKAQYYKRAQTTLTLEFILQKIAEEEKITVEENEIETLIEKTVDPKEKAALKEQKPYLTAILLRQKTLDMLVKPLS